LVLLSCVPVLLQLPPELSLVALSLPLPRLRLLPVLRPRNRARRWLRSRLFKALRLRRARRLIAFAAVAASAVAAAGTSSSL
jgi:hypothetical protein